MRCCKARASGWRGTIRDNGRLSSATLPLAPENQGSAAPADILHEVFGYDQFRGAQAAIVDHVVGGGDALVLMPTGGGKSLCYQIPAMLREGVAVVVSPLIALMQDQVNALLQSGVRAAVLNSTLSPGEAREVEDATLAGELDLLYLAPERLTAAAVVPIANPRAVPVAELRHSLAACVPTRAAAGVAAAVAEFAAESSTIPVVVAGSLFLVGELYEEVLRRQGCTSVFALSAGEGA